MMISSTIFFIMVDQRSLYYAFKILSIHLKHVIESFFFPELQISSFFYLNSSHSKPSWNPEIGSQLFIQTSVQLHWFTSTEHSGTAVIKNCHRENIQPIHSGYIYIGCFYFCFVSLFSPLPFLLCSGKMSCLIAQPQQTITQYLNI